MTTEQPTREKEIFKVTIWGSIVNFILLVFKFFAGIVGHSSAMIADAVHSLSDFITDIIVVVFVRISGKPEDEDHEYGHGKYETLDEFVYLIKNENIPYDETSNDGEIEKMNEFMKRYGEKKC